MSYSYIKSVYPNFEISKVYDERIYNSLNTIQHPSIQIELPEQITKNKIEEMDNTKDNLKFYNLPIPYVGSYANFEGNKNIRNTKSGSNFIDLKSYKEEFDNDKTNTIDDKTNTIDEKTDEKKCNLECDLYIKHILECEDCKKRVIKQFNLDVDKQKNEEIMEIISYMIFGIFVLLLIDNVKQK